MQRILEKTLQDLEFKTVLQQTASYCSTVKGTEKTLQIVPFTKKDELLKALKATNEYVSSFDNENKIPNHFFEPIDQEIKLLGIENSYLEPESFKNITAISATVNQILLFFKKYKDYYPTLFAQSEAVTYTKEIISLVDAIIDRFGEIKDTASNKLAEIRKEITEVKVKINQSFVVALQKYQQADYLDDIRETVVENKRVLAVKAMYRRKVKGTVLGSSKTGSIVYIEPETTLQLSRTLNNLEYEEKEEIIKILQELTHKIRPFKALLEVYQEFLTALDVIAAKAKYALSINGVLPTISQEKKLFLKDAYHPLLYLANKERNEKTYPQTIELHQNNRIIVISGPNAGGKSITLKTIGLLQVMLQSGMLVPVHERSEMCLFDRIMTDIGDNQSIENHLSTYSYRLKQMNYFLKKVNSNSLFLIDEFGTGSDPELGGALAETFLEEFYNREAFGVITTHYANLKMLANELPHATNANMQFDSRTLQPVFKLVLGEAGSSFTFEVAQKNGIPYSLINRAKKKIERGKVRFDATIAKLQKQRRAMEKTSSSLQEEEAKLREENARLEKLNQKIKAKLESYQELFDYNQRMISLGNKIDKIAEDYFIHKKKRALIAEFLRIVETENSKRKQKTKAQKKADRAKKEAVSKELEQKIVAIRQEKKQKKKEDEKLKKQKPKVALKVGDRVRMLDGKAIGSIDAIEKNKAIVNYGLFTTNVSLDQLELVEAKK